MGNSGFLTQMQRPQAQTQAAPQRQKYRGGLQTDFRDTTTQSPYTQSMGNGMSVSGTRVNYNPANSGDSDVDEAQRIENEMSAARRGMNDGVDFAASQAALDMHRSRIGLKNSLAEQIAAQGEMLQGAKSQVRGAANEALTHGIKNTRQNYNSRGLLYSGMREGGEQSVRGAVAGQYAAGMAGAERDSYNATNSAKSAYESVQLANQQEMLDKSKRAFETASANNIARLQAMQQLGQGVGYAGGIYAGGRSSQQPSQSPWGASYQDQSEFNEPLQAGRNVAY